MLLHCRPFRESTKADGVWVNRAERPRLLRPWASCAASRDVLAGGHCTVPPLAPPRVSRCSRLKPRKLVWNSKERVCDRSSTLARPLPGNCVLAVYRHRPVLRALLRHGTRPDLLHHTCSFTAALHSALNVLARPSLAQVPVTVPIHVAAGRSFRSSLRGNLAPPSWPYSASERDASRDRGRHQHRNHQAEYRRTEVLNLLCGAPACRVLRLGVGLVLRALHRHAMPCGASFSAIPDLPRPPAPHPSPRSACAACGMRVVRSVANSTKLPFVR